VKHVTKEKGVSTLKKVDERESPQEIRGAKKQISTDSKQERVGGEICYFQLWERGEKKVPASVPVRGVQKSEQ